MLVNPAVGLVNLAGKGSLSAVSNSSTPGLSASGRFRNNNGASADFSYTPPATLTAATIFGHLRSSGITGPWKTNSSEFDFFPYSDGAFYCNTFASSRYIAAAAAPVGFGGESYVVAARGSSVASTHAAYVNGVKIGSGNSSFVCSASIEFGYNGFGSPCTWFFYALFDRLLSDTTVARISRNLPSLLRKRSIWVPVSAATLGPALVLQANGSISKVAAPTGSDRRLQIKTDGSLVASASAVGGARVITINSAGQWTA